MAALARVWAHVSPGIVIMERSAAAHQAGVNVVLVASGQSVSILPGRAKLCPRGLKAWWQVSILPIEADGIGQAMRRQAALRT